MKCCTPPSRLKTPWIFSTLCPGSRSWIISDPYLGLLVLQLDVFGPNTKKQAWKWSKMLAGAQSCFLPLACTNRTQQNWKSSATVQGCRLRTQETPISLSFLQDNKSYTSQGCISLAQRQDRTQELAGEAIKLHLQQILRNVHSLYHI